MFTKSAFKNHLITTVTNFGLKLVSFGYVLPNSVNKDGEEFKEARKIEFLNYIDVLTTQNMDKFRKEFGTDEVVNRENVNNYISLIERYYSKHIQ